jgi:hypothetical protein
MELPGGEDGLDQWIGNRLDDWIAHFDKQSRADMAGTVREIKEETEGQVPF